MTKNFQIFFLHLQAAKSTVPSTQLNLQVNACGKPVKRREKCAKERFSILT